MNNKTPGERAAEILDSVKAVLADRQGSYDHPFANFQRIAAVWNIFLLPKLLVGKFQGITIGFITARDVGLMMILMKVAREMFKHKEDNLLDIIGYAVCVLLIAEKEHEEAEREFRRD